MSNNDTRGYESNPTETGTDRPQGQRRDAAVSDEPVVEERDQAGTGASLQEYRFSNRNKARTRGVQDSTVDDVFDAIVETVEQKLTVATLTSQSLKDDAGLEHATNQIGKALRELAETDDCPVHVELWGGQSTTPQRWEVSIPTEPVGVPPERLKYSSRTSASVRMLHIDEDCDRLSGAKSITSTLATHPPRGEVCTLCAPDLSMDDLGPGAHSTEADDPQLVTDGGEQFWIVDEQRRAVVDGPFPDRVGAKRADAADDPDTIIVGDRALDLARSERPIRDETEDVDVVTDGGQPVDRSGDSAAGAIDNEFEEAERPAREQLINTESGSDGHPHHLLEAGDIPIDLVTRQPLLLVERVADDLAAYYEKHDFDLLNYKQHTFLPVDIDDAVFECVFIGSIDDLHSFSDTYDYPAGRLARVPVEVATEGDQS